MITPDQAQTLLDGATPGPWGRTQMGALTDTDGNVLVHGPDGNMDDGDANLAAAAPDLAQTIAGMEWEYGLRQPRPEPHAEGELYTSWGYRLFAAKAAFAGLTDRGVECYIVRRLVGPAEVTE